MRLGLLNSRKGVLQVLLPALRLLPPRAATRFVAGLGRAEYRLNPALRRRYRSALTRGAHELGRRWDVPALARELAGNETRWRVRDILLDGRPDAQVEPLLRVEGADRIDGALAEGKGVILLINHFGAFLMPAHWLVRKGYPLRWLTERPRHVSRLLSRDFQGDGPLGQRKLFMSRKADPSEGATAIRRAVRVLQAGMIVQIAGDVRWDGPRTRPGRFLGHEHRFSTTWITLAALSGAPVVCTYGVMLPDGSHRIEFAPPFHVPPDARKDEQAGPWLQHYLDELEQRVLSDPSNSSDYFFWGEPAGMS